jgi:hypothetical protein
MFLPIGVDQSPFDYSGLATTATSSPTAVGALVDTSGVKSGSLVVAIAAYDIAANAQIDITVIAAWKTPSGNIVWDMGTPVATYSLTAGAETNAQLQRVNFTGPLPCPGLMVLVKGVRTSGSGNIRAILTLGLELLPA